MGDMSLKKLEKKAKELSRFLREIEEKDIIIITEGKRDKAALERIGIKKEMFLVNKTLDEVCRKISLHSRCEEVVILTDFDRNGERLCRELEEAMVSYNLHPNIEYRRKLRYILGVSDFEEIDVKMREFEEKLRRGGIHGESIYRYCKVFDSCKCGDRGDG